MQLTRSASLRRLRNAASAVALLAVVWPGLAFAQPAEGVLDRIRTTGKIRLGYRVDARPFSYRDESGSAAGYSAAVCTSVAEAMKAELALPSLSVEWVPVTLDSRFKDVQEGKIDLLCGADTETLTRRKDISFSIPIFPGGIGVLLRSDASYRLKDILSGEKSTAPNWRASTTSLLQKQIFAVVSGTTAADWLSRKVNEFQLTAEVTPVNTYDAGVQRLLDRKADVFFGDRAILFDLAARSQSPGKLIVLERLFTYEPVAIGLARGDDGLRLAVDRALSRLYASGGFKALYEKWFGSPDADALAFFRWNALPD